MLNIIVNTKAGKTKAKKALVKIEKKLTKLSIEYKIYPTKYQGHATEIARDLTKNGNVDVVVVGGDGTLNEVMLGIECFDGVRLGLIPCGTGNDFARMIPLPTKPLKALDIILANNTKPIDYIELKDGRRSINVCGAGMDVDVLEKYAQIKRLKGKLRYYWALLCVLAKLKFHKLKLTLDGKEIEREVFMIAIANGRCIGGGMPISPLSKIDDGLLNVVIINKMPRRRVLPMLLKFLKAKHIYQKGVEQYYVKSAKIEVLDEGRTQVDGELSTNQTLDCEIVPAKLNFFTPLIK